MVYTIRGKAQLNYCPICGRDTEKHEEVVSIYGRSNLVVECPEHGELILG